MSVDKTFSFAIEPIMETIFLCIIAVVFTIFVFSTAAHANACRSLFDHDGRATSNLSSLLDITKTHINGSKNVTNINDSSDVKEWRTHKLGTERWEFILPDNLENSADKIINICENGFDIKKMVLPKNAQYSGVLFLGATFQRVVNRAEFYNLLRKKNLIDKKLKIWVLTGERNLDEKVGETEENFLMLVPPRQKPLPLPRNEFEMIKFVFAYKMPKDITVEYVYSEKDPNHVRATTASTVRAWVEKIPSSPDKTYYVGISNQPYVYLQESSINLELKKMGKKNIIVNVVGGELQEYESANNHAAILLDTISKRVANCYDIYQLNHNYN